MFFTRALAFLKMDTNPEIMNENQRLYIFLANHDYLLKALKEALSKMDRMDDIFLELIDVSLEMLERREFVTDSKHLLLKV